MGEPQNAHSRAKQASGEQYKQCSAKGRQRTPHTHKILYGHTLLANTPSERLHIHVQYKQAAFTIILLNNTHQE